MKIDLKDTWIVVQGPIFWDEENFKIGGTPHDDMIKIIDLYSNYNNVVWSTWEDSPSFILEYIKSKNINLLVINARLIIFCQSCAPIFLPIAF